MSTTNVAFKRGFREALVKGTVVVGVAISGASFADHYVPSVARAAAPPIKPTVSFIKKTSKAYTEPKQKAKVFVISGVKKGAKNKLESNDVKFTAHTTEVEYGSFEFQVSPLKKLAKPLGKIDNMEQFLAISPENLTEVEVADNDIFIPRELR